MDSLRSKGTKKKRITGDNKGIPTGSIFFGFLAGFAAREKKYKNKAATEKNLDFSIFRM